MTQTASNSDLARSFRQKGEDSLLKGDIESAISNGRKALLKLSLTSGAIHDVKFDYLRLLARAYHARGQNLAAERLFESANKISPLSPPLLLERIMVWAELGRWNKIIESSEATTKNLLGSSLGFLGGAFTFYHKLAEFHKGTKFNNRDVITLNHFQKDPHIPPAQVYWLQSQMFGDLVRDNSPASDVAHTQQQMVLDNAIAAKPDCSRFYAAKAKSLMDFGLLDGVREIITNGFKNCGSTPELSLASATFALKIGQPFLAAIKFRDASQLFSENMAIIQNIEFYKRGLECECYLREMDAFMNRGLTFEALGQAKHISFFDKSFVQEQQKRAEKAVSISIAKYLSNRGQD